MLIVVSLLEKRIKKYSSVRRMHCHSLSNTPIRCPRLVDEVILHLSYLLPKPIDSDSFTEKSQTNEVRGTGPHFPTIYKSVHLEQ